MNDFCWTKKCTEFLLYFHCKLCAHSGIFRTHERIKRFIYCSKLRDHVRRIVNECQICKAAKPDYKRKTPLGEYPEAHKPFQRIHADLIGPLPNAPCNFKYILVIIDSFSHFIITEPITKKDSARICRIFQIRLLDNLVSPELIVTDSGSEFTSNEFQNFCTENKIKHHICAPYHKESNGLVERANLQIELGLRCSIIEQGNSWSKHLQNVTEALNNSIHSNVPYSPNEILNNLKERLNCPGFISNDIKICQITLLTVL